jgi:hypothetical protein
MKTLLSLIISLWCISAVAHKPSDSYLTLNVNDNNVSGRWDIALRDLDFALTLDANNDGVITWGEVRAQKTSIERYVFSYLHLDVVQQTCNLQPGEMKVDKHSDGAYAVLLFTGRCSDALSHAGLTVGYNLFASFDKQHRGLLSLIWNGTVHAAVLSPNLYRVFAPSETQWQWPILADFVREGIYHIAVGYDHILFLISLLIPSVLVYRMSSWFRVPSFKAALWDVITVVTAFTLAHSITLSIAVLGFVSLPSRWVESAIAASVALAALNNVTPIFRAGRAWLAFTFGLVHGFGFASVLSDLSVAQTPRFWSLLGFNLGVEIGQLMLVAIFLPCAYYLSKFKSYQRLILKTSSLAIASMGMLWFLQRGFDVNIKV